MQQTGVIVGVIALVVGGAIGFSVGSGQKETVEVEKIVEVEKSVVSTLSQVKEKGCPPDPTLSSLVGSPHGFRVEV